MSFGGGGGKRQEIDRVSNDTKNLIRQMISQQQQATERGTQAAAADLDLMRQQIQQQNAQVSAVQHWQGQAITAQEGIAKQYQSGLNEQLTLLKQQNSLLNRQAQDQSAYYESARQFQTEQRALQGQQLAREKENTRYTGLLQQNEKRMAGSSANRLLLQVNRRRAINRLGAR